MERHGIRRQWMSARDFLVAAIAVAVTAVVFLVFRSSPPPPATRAIEPRVCGVAWAPFRPMPVSAATSVPIARTRGVSGPDVTRGANLIDLLAGGAHRETTEIVSAAAESSNDARIWSDLAAVRHETALRYDAPELLATALAAADRALDLDPTLPEALFNRALIIEHLGLRDDGREAWQRYLDVDSTSDWAVEARSHVAGLAPAEPFLRILDREYARVANSDAAAARLVARDPFGARGMGVMEVLGRWGHAVLRGDGVEADRHLNVARRLGAAVARNGDRMLERSVAAIDGADVATRSLLARAHADYRDGLDARQRNRLAEAEPLLRGAAAVFDRVGSPMVVPARSFAASTRSERGHRDEAESELRALLDDVAPEFPAYRALVLLQLGTCHVARADWGAGMALLEESASLFERVREPQNVGAANRTLAFAYDQTGDPTTAWKHRTVALRGVGGEPSITLEKTLSSIARAAMLRRDWHTASSFLTLRVAIARRLGRDYQIASTLLARCVVRDRLGDPQGAEADLAAARAVARRATDRLELLRMEELRATAALSTTPAARAETLLSEAIEFGSARGERFELPALLLQRARARRAGGDATGAMADLELGISELERHRESLPEGEARWGAFHAAEELFDDAIEVTAARDDAWAAFRYAERARARALLDAYDLHSPVDVGRLPRDTVVVEYVALPSQLIIFTVDASGVRMARVEGSREMLASEIETFTTALRDDRRALALRAAGVLHRRLIEPIASRLAGAATIVFVPDGVTSTVAFAALADAGGRYLIEDHAIVVAPSASAFAAAAERRRQTAVPRSALLISASAAAAGAGALPLVEIEMRRIGEVYARVRRITDAEAQFDELIARAPDADVISFAGHAVGDERGYEPASIVLRQNGRERRVRVGEIAKLRLQRTAIVVLAGCSTARGERRAAEGVISVAHGFLVAGAPSVIATLWPIPDAAAAGFFPRLHRHLAEGVAPAEALRVVQREAIRNGDVPPSMWAAVVAVGS